MSYLFELQTQIALSTMESEYIALSQSIKKIIAMWEVLRKIQMFVISGKKEYSA